MVAAMKGVSLADIIARNGYTHFCCGSLPFREADSALQFVIVHPWVVPFWPELPRVSPAEYILSRAERVLSEQWAGYAPSEALGLYSMKHYLRERGIVLPLLKCQATGPLSVLEYSRALSGRNWEEAIDTAVAVCLRQIEWQMQFFEGLCESLLFVIDEPALVKWRELDEGRQARIIEAYSTIYVSVSERGGFTGIHSCCEFSRDLLAFPIDLYSFDASSIDPALMCGSAPREGWEGALRHGMILAPGVFPAVLESHYEEHIECGLAIYGEIWRALTPSLPENRRQLLLAANCGHGTASLEWVTALYAQTTPERLAEFLI